MGQCESAVFHIIPDLQLRYREESSACSTGVGYCNLLFLLTIHLSLPLRTLSLQMLSVLECGFSPCDRYIQTSSPSGLRYPDPCSCALVSVPNTSLGSVYLSKLLNINPHLHIAHPLGCVFLDSSTEILESHLISLFVMQEATPYKQETAVAFGFFLLPDHTLRNHCGRIKHVGLS